MNRLLIGDVGFGKTEVAFRAIAAPVFSGKQAILIAPSTVLVRQHFQSIRDGFAETEVTIAEISRLSQTDGEEKLVDRIKSGDIQIVVGTTAVLNNALSLPDLALIVIDEERKLGVNRKPICASCRLKRIEASQTRRRSAPRLIFR